MITDGTQKEMPMLTTLQSRPVRIYLAVTFLLSWAIWVPMALARIAWGPAAAPPVLGLVGALAPGVAALITAAVVGGRREAARLLGRLGHWRFGPGWYVAAGLNVGLLLVAYSAALALSAAPPPPTLTLGAILFMLLIQMPNTACEELGWRGWLQPHLQTRASALAAAGVVGVIWFAWHLPYWVALSNFTTDDLLMIVLNALWIIPMAVLMAWLVNSTGSVLPSWLCHLSTNVVIGLLPITSGAGTSTAYLFVILLTWLAVALIIRRYGPAHLARPWPPVPAALPYAPAPG
jgi:membrane protease YdiL (CAAX protease family)